MGAVIRDDLGQVMASATWNRKGAPEPLQAEVMAMLQTIILAKECCFSLVIFETDSLDLIRFLFG
ncbi:hypothetical protein A2U01_0094157, partial [Trifolium medium]|nr:hypothetical protein [Trifolium medium]